MGDNEQAYCVACGEPILESQPGKWRHDLEDEAEARDLDEDHEAIPDYGEEDLQ